MHRLSRWLVGLFASPIGLIVLAALDSTIFFSLPFGIDAAVIIVAARGHGMPVLAPVLATAGSLGGAALSFWMGRALGEKGLERYVAQRRLKSVRARINRSGAIALALLDLIPPPFPFSAFLLAAGALEVDAGLFFVTLAGARLLRFGAESLLAFMFGRRILGWIDSDLFHDVVSVCIVLAIVGSVVTVIRLTRSTRPSRRRTAA